MIICITGTYKSGKTTAAKYFGLKTINADSIGRKIFRKKKEEIRNVFIVMATPMCHWTKFWR